jgi:sugar phosphate permease
VGTLTATFVLGSLLAFMSWRGMLWIAAIAGCGVALVYGFAMRDSPSGPIPDDSGEPDSGGEPAPIVVPVHPLDAVDLPHALPRIFGSLRFWLISGSLMGLTILWDFLLVVPMYMQDVLHLEEAQASRAASAFPLGSLISVLIGGYVFDRLDRKRMGWVMGGLLTIATGCLLLFAGLSGWGLSATTSMLISLALLFLFGLCVSPCYYIPCSVFAIDCGGRHSGVLIALLDAIGFAATAAFYYFCTGIAQHAGWNAFLFVLAGIGAWSVVATFFFMQREARHLRRRSEGGNG